MNSPICFNASEISQRMSSRTFIVAMSSAKRSIGPRSLALEAPVDAVYGVIRAGLERIGQPIGANDLLIAAHARALDLTLVTDNEREFSRIENLRVENWL